MNELEQLTELLQKSSNIVAFTGAGVSTESNIPDFRSSGGMFETLKKKYNQPAEVILSHSFFINHPEWFYDFYRNGLIFKDALPNDCHKALYELELMGKLKAVITQNIDGLHQAAGSKNVLEIHGTTQKNYCMKCGKKFELDYIMNLTLPVPLCDKCGGIIRPDIVLYEEQLDEELIERSISLISEADMLLIIGTSLVVYPAAGFINYYRGKRLILINRSGTPYDDKANLVIKNAAGEVMKTIVKNLHNN